MNFEIYFYCFLTALAPLASRGGVIFLSISESKFRCFGFPDRGFRMERIAKKPFSMEIVFDEFRNRFVLFFDSLGVPGKQGPGYFLIDFWIEISMLGTSRSSFSHGMYCKKRLFMEIVLNEFRNWILLFLDSLGTPGKQGPGHFLSISESKFRCLVVFG